MPYLNTNTRTSKTTGNENFQPLGRSAVLHGLYLGFVKNANDVQRNGRLEVWIPEFGSAPDEEQGWITVNYCSPFAGATNIESASKTDKESFEGTQTSYGMWMVPPDINNEVLVMFIGGNVNSGVWIGCLYNQYMNNMVPTSPATAKNWQYPGKAIPAAEYNKWDSSVTNPDAALKPYNKTKFSGIGNQGLLRDGHRGITTSTARREAPSQIFGIVTPGPKVDVNAKEENVRRKGGSSFVMDDGAGSEYIQLATKTGAQIKIDETNGFIYMINRDGTSWVQMDKDGNIDIFGAKDLAIRAQRDINFRADRNINIEAGQNLFLKAAKDTKKTTTKFTNNVNNTPVTTDINLWKYVGEGEGEGGNLVMQANGNWHSTTTGSAFLSVTNNNLNIGVGNAVLMSTVNGGIDVNSNMGIKITSGGAVDLLAAGLLRGSATKGISFATEGPISLCAKDQFSANGDMGIALSSTKQIAVIGEALFAESVWMGGELSVNDRIIASQDIKAFQIITDPTMIEPKSPQRPLTASTAKLAEVKPLNDKINILAGWADTSKFVRNSEAFSTTVSRLPTYEPCPEHSNFRMEYISGYVVPSTSSSTTYTGSGAAGNTSTGQPHDSSDPGSDNNSITGDSALDSSLTKDFNMNAFRCQLINHEGRKAVSYYDSVGKATGGIGHLLRQPTETSRYPVGAPISDEQIENWYQQDSSDSIRAAIELLGNDCWNGLSDVRKRACADLAYNLGKAGLGKFKNFLAAIKANNWQVAGQELRSSVWYGQVARRGPDIVTMIVQNVDPLGCDKKFPPSA